MDASRGTAARELLGSPKAMAMPGEELASHLSRISTHWDLLFAAHQGEATVMRQAQQELLRRYCGAIYRYLLSVVRDPDAAADLSQEFALRFVRGSFRNADPEHGRFRDFVKKCLYHLIIDHRRLQQAHPKPLPAELPDGDDRTDDWIDDEFNKHWRGEILGRTWEALASQEKETGQLFHTVLHWRAGHPQIPAAQLAHELSIQLGKPFTEGAIRVQLHRARAKFADLLLDEVARSLQSSATERIEQELIDLDLLAYCKAALKRRKQECPDRPGAPST
jgi:RNA polymerase sigma factor (sigma-70 family)